MNEPLAKCAVSPKCWFIRIGLWVVAYESLKTKEKSKIKKVVVTRAGRLREWLQGELLLYVSLDLVAEQQARRNRLIIYSY